MMFLVLSMLTLNQAYAGWFDDAVKGAAEGVGNRAVNETADGAYEGAKGKLGENKIGRAHV
jgi:hypothetical protein